METPRSLLATGPTRPLLGGLSPNMEATNLTPL